MQYTPAMHARWNKALLTAVTVIVGGCKNDPLQVNLAPGFLGDVQINCVSYGDNMKPINVGYSGRIDDAVCPHSKTVIKIKRDGKAVKPTGNVLWEETGDGIPVQIRFTVR